MRSYQSQTHILIRKGRSEDKEELHKKEGHVIMETEIAVIKLAAKEHQGLPANI